MAGSFNGLYDINEVEKRKQDLVAGQEKAYQDALLDYQNQEDLFRNQYDRSKGNINNQLGQTIQQANTNALQQTTQARQNYGDLITQTRRRARAVGGSSQSGVLELYNMLDRDLQQNVYGINATKGSAIDQANTVATQALGDLEAKLTETIAAIDSDRRLSLREKDAALREIEYQATAAANAIREWQAAKTRTSGGYYYNTPTTSNMTSTGSQPLSEFGVTYTDEQLMNMSQDQLYNVLINNVPSGDPWWQVWEQKYTQEKGKAPVTEQPTTGIIWS